MKKFLVIFAGLIVLIGAAVVLSPFLLPQSVLERQLAPVLARATGLELEEARRLRLSVYPAPGVALEGVRAHLPFEGGDGPVVRAERIIAGLRSAALLEGRLELGRVTLVSPSYDIYLAGREQSSAGLQPGVRSAVLLETGDAPQLIRVANEARPAAGRPFNAPEVQIEVVDGSMTVHGRNGPVLSVSDADIVFDSPAGGEALTARGQFLVEGEPVTLKAVAAPAQEVARTQLELSSAAGLTEISGDLSLRGKPRFAGRFQSQLASAEALGRMSRLPPRLLAKVEGSRIEGRLEMAGRQLLLSDAVLETPDAKGNLTVAADLAGTARAQLSNLQLHGGRGEGVATLERKARGLALGASLSLSNVDVLALTQSVSHFDWLSGQGDVQIELASRGTAPGQLIDTLKGEASFSVTDGTIRGLDLPEIVADVEDGDLSQLRRNRGKQTPFERLQASYRIEGAVARTDDLKMTGPNIEVAGKGKTNFLEQSVDYRLQTRVTAEKDNGSGERAVFTMPVSVQGDWVKPAIFPDVNRAFKDKESLRGTAKLFGKSVEKLTGGQVKAGEFGNFIDGLLGKKKRDDEDEAGAENED